MLIAGTGTEVGKTWVGARLLHQLREGGHSVAARKPAQSHDGTGPSDAALLSAASGEPEEVICPAHRDYPLALAPFMAAERLGLPPFTLDDLVAELAWPVGVDIGVVEAAGGVRSPIASDGGDTVDLANRIDPDSVVLVADAGLGTINAVRLAADALAGQRVVVVLNRFDSTNDLHRANHRWLADALPHPVLAGDDELSQLVLGG